jgi:hypothetical protein
MAPEERNICRKETQIKPIVREKKQNKALISFGRNSIDANFSDAQEKSLVRMEDNKFQIYFRIETYF